MLSQYVNQDRFSKHSFHLIEMSTGCLSFPIKPTKQLDIAEPTVLGSAALMGMTLL